jgi:hypothetical protein
MPETAAGPSGTIKITCQGGRMVGHEIKISKKDNQGKYVGQQWVRSANHSRILFGRNCLNVISVFSVHRYYDLSFRVKTEAHAEISLVRRGLQRVD